MIRTISLTINMPHVEDLMDMDNAAAAKFILDQIPRAAYLEDLCYLYHRLHKLFCLAYPYKKYGSKPMYAKKIYEVFVLTQDKLMRRDRGAAYDF